MTEHIIASSAPIEDTPGFLRGLLDGEFPCRVTYLGSNDFRSREHLLSFVEGMEKCLAYGKDTRTNAEKEEQDLIDISNRPDTDL